MDNYTKRFEALEECERLKALTGREMEPRSVDCECDEWPSCYLCAGAGRYLKLYYVFCSHLVTDDDLECIENDCAQEERLRDCMEQTRGYDDPFLAKPIKSLSEIESEREELEAVR